MKALTEPCLCPNCDKTTTFMIEITKAHVRIDCQICHKVFFYRRVNLGAVEK